MAPNRLLLVTPDFPPHLGGVARYLDQFARYFFDRTIVLTSAQGSSQQTLFTVREEPLLSKFVWPKWMKTVRRLIQLKNQYDLVIVSHVLPFGTAAWMASWLIKKPFVVITHGMDIRLATRSSIKRFVTRLILRRARVVVANSQALSSEIALRFRIPLPLTVYPCVEPSKTMLKKSKTNVLHILTVSRLVPRKGHMKILMALSRLKQSGEVGEFRYDIVGDGPTREGLEQIVHELHLREVFFHGEVSEEEKNEFYARADLFLMPVLDDPVDKEGFGMVFLEAAQYGIPSIGSTIEGVSEAILDGQTGRLVEPGNLDELTRVIAELANNDDKRESLGRQARARVEQTFTCKAQFEKLEPFL